MRPAHPLTRPEIWILLLYEGMVLFLFLGAVVPHGTPLRDFLSNPLGQMQINETSIALALALFLPLLFKQMKSLKLFGTEIELQEVKADLKEVKQEISARQFDQERALYALAASMGRSLEIHSERRRRSVEEVPLEIGTLDFTESQILSEIVWRLIDSHNVPALPPARQESTLTTFFKLRSGAIDLFVSYSGAGMELATMPMEDHTAEEARERLNRVYRPWGLVWLLPLGFDNREVLVMQKEKAESLKIASMSDLAERADQFTFGANREFFLREWAYPRLERRGMAFSRICEVDINNRLDGLLKGSFDVGVLWTTDPEMDDHRLTVIPPDEHFPVIPQYAMPVCQERAAKQLEPILASLQISETEMRKLNRLARRAGSTPLAIKGLSQDFLRRRI